MKEVIEIPWQPSDAPKHTRKADTEAKKKKWAETANSVLKQCKKDGGDQEKCEAKAIRIANSKVGKKSNSGEEDMKRKTLQAPKSRFTFYSEEPLVELSGDGEESPKTFSMVAYTGNPMPDIFGGSIAVDVGGIEFGGKKRYPILEEHSRERKIGVATGKPDTSNNQVYIGKVQPLTNEKAQEFVNNLEDGFPYQSSISIAPKKIEEVPDGENSEVNGMKFKGPGIIVRSSRFKEASVCVFGRDENTKVQENSADDQEEFEVDVINFNSDNEEDAEFIVYNEDDKNNTDGGNSMDWNEFKEQYPEWAKLIEQSTEKDQQIAEKDKQIKELTDNNSDMSERLKKLELSEAARHERDLKAQAENIIEAHLKDTCIPERLHGKVKAQLNHKKFVDQEGNLDEESFKEKVQTEVKEWNDTFTEYDTGTVQGTGGTGSGTGDNSEEFDSDKISDHLVSLVTATDKE